MHLKLCNCKLTELRNFRYRPTASGETLATCEEHTMKPRVLLADDDEAVRSMLRSVLERDGFEVVATRGVKEALRHIAEENFDVLLSDLHMPHAGDGFTVVSAMRHTPTTHTQ